MSVLGYMDKKGFVPGPLLEAMEQGRRIELKPEDFTPDVCFVIKEAKLRQQAIPIYNRVIRLRKGFWLTLNTKEQELSEYFLNKVVKLVNEIL